MLLNSEELLGKEKESHSEVTYKMPRNTLKPIPNEPTRKKKKRRSLSLSFLILLE